MAFKPITTKSAAAKMLTPSAAPGRESQVEDQLVTLEEERVYREGTVTIRDLIAPSAFKVESSFLQLGTVVLRTIFVVSYPRYINIGWSAPILNLNVTMDLSMFF